MDDFRSRLLHITRGCRPDMHEPDEQDVVARVVGDHLDNAFGEQIRGDAVEGCFQEFVVILERREEHQPFEREKFNLASLIALARLPAEHRPQLAEPTRADFARADYEHTAKLIRLEASADGAAANARMHAFMSNNLNIILAALDAAAAIIAEAERITASEPKESTT